MSDQKTDFNAGLTSNGIPRSVPGFPVGGLQHSGRRKSFSLPQLLEGIFSKLYPLFSVDCAALVVYEQGCITHSYVTQCNACGECTCQDTLSRPVSLCPMTAEISEFQFPVLKSAADWTEQFGENHHLLNHPADYLFHCYIPLESNNQVLGTFELHNLKSGFSAEVLSFCCNISDLLSGLLATMDKEEELPEKFLHESAAKDHHSGGDELEGILLSFLPVLKSVSATGSRNEFVAIIKQHLTGYLKAGHAEVYLLNNDHTKVMDNHAEGEGKAPADIAMFPFDKDSIGREVRLSAVETLPCSGIDKAYIDLLIEKGIRTFITLPLSKGDIVAGVVAVGLTREVKPGNSLMNILEAAATQISLALWNVFATEQISEQLIEIQKYKEKISEHTLHAEEELPGTYHHPEIAGSSAPMQQVFRLLERISAADTTVLILGETGTGKDLVAKAIHNGSDRRQKRMIKINCGAIPPNLVESELFGHEKGSFTGATERRIGKFEQADKSTIFLDEVGELSADLQVKLLRVLQEKEIERIGGKNSITIDVRIISATNRNLIEEVEAGRFRTDLFYRLNVFPVTLPPLRARKSDIPALAAFFLAQFNARSGRKIIGFSKKLVSAMMAYSWPGNVRELEQLIERQVLLTQGPMISELDIPDEEKGSLAHHITGSPVKTILENERDHILSVLERCNGKISGPHGAARLLGIPATTLNSKIKRLGLSKKHSY